VGDCRGDAVDDQARRPRGNAHLSGARIGGPIGLKLRLNLGPFKGEYLSMTGTICPLPDRSFDDQTAL
jgi:hypothetical protein